eukprot:CAMPEP_0198114488 /NCGR_PEP_ID=MMETSP1442-20131203/5855_1 /TAXON_ID= /ORGANISM="Craspedostauros australis, Strain CCMP3328" /LENGTH=267 /DNA_ID=CAMNT_0043771805 /DNA_START=184 /DNA_END=987 /DNA_ORIENTATION=-
MSSEPIMKQAGDALACSSALPFFSASSSSSRSSSSHTRDSNAIAAQSQAQARTQQRRQRRLRFSADVEAKADSKVVTKCKPSPKQQQQQTPSETWYSARDILSFRLHARNIVLFGNPNNEDTRGLERYDIERAQQKALYAKLITKASRAYPADKVAAIAHNLSTRSRELAAAQALQDLFQVYLMVDMNASMHTSVSVESNNNTNTCTDANMNNDINSSNSSSHNRTEAQSQPQPQAIKPHAAICGAKRTLVVDDLESDSRRVRARCA